MVQKRFSKDPKVKLISIQKFLEESNYLINIKSNIWDDNLKLNYGRYYKITSRFLIIIDFTIKLINFGEDISEMLESIQVAYRDGITEYQLIDKHLKILNEKKNKNRNIREINKQIKNIEAGRNFLDKIKYNDLFSNEYKNIDDYIVDVEYKTSIESLKGKYVVVDVETNGIRTSNDDLLSISIYDPTTGKCYNRFLPLDLQPMVLTSWIHGITDKDLECCQHITQKEIDSIINYFDLNNKILLSYSGGHGKFDSSFIINYCKRHNLVGFETLNYRNIKNLFSFACFGSEGQLTKDNLCSLLRIEGVDKTHSSLNDCILEWKLFEKIETQPLFFIGEHLFKYNKGYIVPVTYLNKIPELKRYADISVPNIEGKATCVFNYEFPEQTLKEIKKFPTNITGISIENAINAFLSAKKQDNFKFLLENKKKLEYVGSLNNRLAQIPIEILEDGTIKSLNPKYDVYIDEINNVAKIMMGYMHPVFEYIKDNIFKTGEIFSQELSISDDGKVLALCDLSNKESILEIKTFNINTADNFISKSLTNQLFYESKGRNVYILSIDIKENHNINQVESIITKIYRINIINTDDTIVERVRVLSETEFKVLEMISNNQSISNIKIAKEMQRNIKTVGRIVNILKTLKYIEKEGKSKRYFKWKILRDINDKETKFAIYKGKLLNEKEKENYS